MWCLTPVIREPGIYFSQTMASNSRERGGYFDTPYHVPLFPNASKTEGLGV